MYLLVIGLVLFAGIHLLPVSPPLRSAALAGLGAQRYKAVFSIVSFAGLAMIVLGYRMADPATRLFAPVPAAISLAPYAVTAAFVLFAAANMRAHLRRVVQHPMLLGLGIWSFVHLLANGDLRGTVLFGALLAYAVVDWLSAVQRRAVKSFEPTAQHDVIAVAAGVVLAVVVMAFHRPLFGAGVVPFGY
jgi:uncharacterized membrane protein